MNVTLILQQSIGSALRKFSTSLTSGRPATPEVCRASSVRSNQPAKQTHAKPLRVVRFVEGGMPRASVGRMVISGSMADVCAELDRLAAQEMKFH
jgi:hypothetical protein